MYTIELNINTTGYDEYLEKRFKYGYKLKRALVNYFNLQERRRRGSEEYKYLSGRMQELNELQDKIVETKDKEQKKSLKADYKAFSDEMKSSWISLNEAFGLGNGKFVDYKSLGQASEMYSRYAANGIINWSTFENMAQATKAAYLQRRKQAQSDNFLRVPRYVDFDTMWYRKCNQNITPNGLRFGKRGNYITFPYSFQGTDEIRFTYAMERQKIAWYAIKRILNRHNQWKYSVLIVFNGEPYGVDQMERRPGKVYVSVDVDKLAIKTEDEEGEVVYYDIANDYGYSKKLANLDRQIEASRRLSNPNNFEENGVIKEGARKWVQTNNYKKLLAKKRTLWHKIKQARKNRFISIVNSVVQQGDEFIIIKDDFKGLQEKIKFDPETMNWYDKRRQRGAEIMFNAPYEFLTRLKQKVGYLGFSYSETTRTKGKGD